MKPKLERKQNKMGSLYQEEGNRKIPYMGDQLTSQGVRTVGSSTNKKKYIYLHKRKEKDKLVNN